jgi:hypothetical protein
MQLELRHDALMSPVPRISTPEPPKKRFGSTSYLWGALLSTALAVISAVALQSPIFIKLFVPFPALSEAQVLTGKVEVVGHWHTGKHGVEPPKYYIVTDTGRQEFFCGFSMARDTCFTVDEYNIGAIGTIWLHPTFGVIQYALKRDEPWMRQARMALESKDPAYKNRTAQDWERETINLKDESSYTTEKMLFDSHFNYKRHIEGIVMTLALLLGALYQWTRYFSLRRERASGLIASTN